MLPTQALQLDQPTRLDTSAEYTTIEYKGYRLCLQWPPALAQVITLSGGSTARTRLDITDMVEIRFQFFVPEFLEKRMGKEFHPNV